METGDMFEHWVAAARGLSLSENSTTVVAADDNMLVFELPERADAGAIEVALRSIQLEYDRKALASKKSGYFYTWVSEQSGTLRCSFCEISSANDLPFRARVRLASTLGEIAAAAALASTSEGILWEDLVVVPWSPPDDAPVDHSVLVFAQSSGEGERP